MTDGQDRTGEVTADVIRANAIVPTGRLRGLSIMPPGPPSRLVVDGFATVHRDGRIEYADGYGPDAASRAFWDAVGWRARESTATSSERPGCATPIREAGEVTMELLLLALPSEPPLGSRVELRGLTRTFPYVRVGAAKGEPFSDRTWRGDTHAAGFSRTWRELCTEALGGELWLIREGPAPTNEEPA